MGRGRFETATPPKEDRGIHGASGVRVYTDAYLATWMWSWCAWKTQCWSARRWR
jgi:hypothetical protein